MSRRVFCRYCDHPADMVAGECPKECEKCGEGGFWSSEQGRLVQRKFKKRPRVPYAVTRQDYHLFLKRVRIARE